MKIACDRGVQIPGAKSPFRLHFYTGVSNILNLNDAIPLCMCNKFYCKVPSIHNNLISVVVFQLVNQATCFGRFIRPSSGLQRSYLKVQCKQWDTIGRVNECTLIDNMIL